MKSPPPDIRVFVGANVRRLRREAQLTQEQFAEASGLSVSYLQKVERGAVDPSATTLVALASALETSLDALVAEAKPEERRVGRPPSEAPEELTEAPDPMDPGHK